MRSLLIPSVVVLSIAARFKLPPEAKWYELILRATASVLSHCMGDICFGLWKHPYFSPGIIVNDFLNFLFSCVKLVVLWINCIKQWYLWWKKILKVHKERSLDPRQHFTRKKENFSAEENNKLDEFGSLLKFAQFRLKFTRDARNWTNSNPANRTNSRPKKIRLRFVPELLLN
jgi:hypothetical protein